MIKPTVGRIVLYRPSGSEYEPDTRYAAIITRVWPDGSVDLAVFAPNGNHYARTSIQLLQDGEEAKAPYAEWMPYQKGQAAKTEALEKALGK